MWSDRLDAIMAVMDAAFDPKFGEAWTAAQLAGAMIAPGTHCVTISNEGTFGPRDISTISGFYMTRQVVDEEELLLIAVAPAARGAGLGGKMLAHLEEQARQRGSALLHLEMRADNPAQSLYTKFGFEPVGRRKKYYKGADGVMRDAITFVKSLR